MLCVCVGDVMDVVCSVWIVRRGAVGAKQTPLSETKHQHNANLKMVFHKAACYHPHSSTYTHLTLQHNGHQ